MHFLIIDRAAPSTKHLESASLIHPHELLVSEHAEVAIIEANVNTRRIHRAHNAPKSRGGNRLKVALHPLSNNVLWFANNNWFRRNSRFTVWRDRSNRCCRALDSLPAGYIAEL
eukprot:18229-Pleurochrysis_carterae.AAC.1